MTLRRTPRIPIPQDTRTERWRDVVGWEGTYMVSDCGRVYSIIREKFFRPRPNARGYHRAALRTGPCTVKHALVHVLVAAAFIGPCPVGKEVNHKNGIRNDNHPGNLEYITHPENIAHAWQTGLRKNRVSTRKLSDCQVIEVRRRWRDIQHNRGKFPRGAVKSLAAEFGVSTQCIYTVGVGKCWQSVEG